MRFNVVPSPCGDVVLRPYDPSAFPKFQNLFELDVAGPARFLALDAGEAQTALVLENSSTRALMALCYQWVAENGSGKPRTHTVSSDSYSVEEIRPVLEAGSRLLITRSKSVTEALIDQVLTGGGVLAAGSAIDCAGADIVDLTFQINFLLFEDGEIAGPDPERYGLSLQCRKRGAQFVARQVRLARAEGRDARPVLSALAEIPHFGRLHRAEGDPLVKWTQYYSAFYLRQLGSVPIPGTSRAEMMLRHLENLPDVPKFYRREH